MTQQERINQVKSETARKLLQNLHDAWVQALEIPNNMLPERYQDDRTTHLTIRQIEKKYRKFNKQRIRLEQLEKRENRVDKLAEKYQQEEQYWHDCDYGQTDDLAEGLTHALLKGEK